MEYYTAINGRLVKIWFIPEGLAADQIIPPEVSVIGHHSFSGIKELTEIVIPEHVVEIEQFAFYKCPNLRKVSVDQKVEKIGYGAFADCESLEEFYFNTNNGFEDFVFHGCRKLHFIQNEKSQAECFYFPTSDSFFIAKPVVIKDINLQGCEMFEGRVADNPFPAMAPNLMRTLCYMAVIRDSKGTKYYYRNRDALLASVGAAYQASHKSFSEYFNKHLEKNTVISWVDFAFLTGLCNYGEKLWKRLVEQYGDPTVINVYRVLRELSPVVAKRFQDAVDKQDVEFNLLSFEDYLSDEEAEKIIKKLAK